MAKKQTEATIEVQEMSTNRVEFCILGRTPIILNRMSEKAKYELLFPKGRKTAAQKATSLKHNPYREFIDSPYTIPDEKAPTYIAHLATSFKAAIRGAGVDVPGATKAQLGRLMWVEGERVPLFGEPRLHMSVTRSADMNKTPDIRTRCCIPYWACKVSVSFVTPQLNAKTVGNLLAAAGLTQGVGDWRPEKGSGNYGQFDVVSPDDPEFVRIIKEGGREVQKKAMENPVPYDVESEELLTWFYDEADRRGIKIDK
ncbi:MAG: hypothetical protein ACOCQI_06310 [Desulfosalsimonas sp.]